jgi:hypothetical protein
MTRYHPQPQTLRDLFRSSIRIEDRNNKRLNSSLFLLVTLLREKVLQVYRMFFLRELCHWATQPMSVCTSFVSELSVQIFALNFCHYSKARMLKTKYELVDQDIPVFRGVLHILTFWIWFGISEPLLGVSYLISFCYHRLPFAETVFKFLDHELIVLRAVFFERVTPLGIFLGILPIFWFLFYPRINYDYFRLYIVASAVVMSLWYISQGMYNKIASGILYIIPGLIYQQDRTMFWHVTGVWSSHEDFHTVLFLLDMVLRSSSG